MSTLKYILFLVAIVAMLLSVGCKVRKQTKISSEVQKSWDSVNVFESVELEKKRLLVKADSAENELDLRITAIKSFSCHLPHCSELRDTSIVIKSGRATQTTKVKGGVITNKCKCDTASIEYTIEKRLRREFNQRLIDNKTTVTEVKTVEVPYYPWWLKILAGIGVAAIVYTSFRIIYFLKK